MPTFAYIARDEAGRKVEGQLAAAGEPAVLAELQSRHLAPVRVTAVRERRSRGRVPVRVLAGMYRQLSELLGAGVPLLRAVRLLARNRANPVLPPIMGRIADEVADGSSLADAMSGSPEVFPTVQVAMIRAGERGGFLESVLERTADYLERQAEMRAKVIGSLIYPVVLLVVGTLLVVAALVFLVPQFADFFGRIELPLPTRILLGLSALLKEQGLWVLGGVVVAVVLFRWTLRQPAVRLFMARVAIRLPRVGGLIRDIAVARFARLLGTLLANGIPMIAAMQISRDAVGNPVLEEAIDDAIEAVRAGESLAQPLAASGLLAEETVEIISIGEAANRLPDVLLGLSNSIERRIDQGLTLVVRFIEPALLLVLGLMIFFIFVALIVPVLRMRAAI